MIGIRNTLSLVALLTFYLCGCASTPAKITDYSKLDKRSKKFAETREQLAREYEANGALTEAQREWQLIDAVLQPKSSSARVEIDRLERKATIRVQKYLQAAHKAETRGNYTTARLKLLKVLALKPDNTRAINKLKQLEKRRSYTRLALAPLESTVFESEEAHYTASNLSSQKNERKDKKKFTTDKKSSVRAVLDKEQSNHDVRKFKTKEVSNSLQRGLAHYSRKEYKYALRYFLIARRREEGERELVDKYIARTHRALAKQHYEQGVIAFRAARYDQAVIEFEQALEYAPQHKKARLYHSSAKALQKR